MTGITIGASGNKAVLQGYIGTSGGNKAILSGWIGTAGGNKVFYTSFTPTTNIYTSGSGASETIPVGTSSLTITAFGAGGSGGDYNVASGGGGGGGAKCVKTIAISSSDWGGTLTYSAGNTATITGTVAAGTIAMTANAGSNGAPDNVEGIGGTASGGDTNLSGSDGGPVAGVTVFYGGAAASGGGGTQTVSGAAGNAPGGGGAGAALSGSGGAGALGQVSFAWS